MSEETKMVLVGSLVLAALVAGSLIALALRSPLPPSPYSSPTPAATKVTAGRPRRLAG